MKSLRGKKVLCIMPIPIVPLIGTSIRCMRQIRGLIDNGMEVTLLCPQILDRDSEKKLNDPFFAGVRVLPVLFNHRNAVIREIGTIFRSSMLIRRLIQEEKPDIVHVHNPPDTMPFVAALAGKAKGVPILYDIHDAALETIPAVEFPPLVKTVYLQTALFFEREAVRRSRALLFVSDTARDSFMRTRRIVRQLGEKLLFAVMKNTDPSYAEAPEQEPLETEDYILYSGTLYSNLIGLEEFIDAFQDIAREYPTKVLIAGDGPYKKRFVECAAKKGLEDRIVFLGFLDRWDLRKVILGAKFCVIPYKSTLITRITLPHKVFEYMAYAKAIVHPDFPGFAEVLGPENAGIYRADDRADLVRAMQRMISDKELRDKTGRRNRELLNEISFEKELGKMLDLYSKIL